jgi:hypothetical protein
MRCRWLFCGTILLSVLPAFAQKPNPACTALTSTEVASLIGAAKAIPISQLPTGSTCMLQERDKVLTVLLVEQSSAENAASLAAAKKRIVSGEDLPGIGTSAYAGAMGGAAVVGVVKGNRFIEVKAIDKTQKVDELSAKLKAVMKSVAARL